MANITRLKKREDLISHSNYSFCTIEKEHWYNTNLSNSLFNGAIFSDCLFENIQFDQSDLEGSRFYHCTFYACSFVSADFHSIWASDCQFNKILFNNSNIIDSTFKRCHLSECIYDGIVLSKSNFERCFIDQFIPENSSITLNKFIETTFKKAIFKNVFYYHIFEDCQFINSKFEAYLLGYVYGLSLDNINDLDCLFMGNSSDTKLRSKICDIESVYLERKMYLNLGVLRLWENQTSRELLMIQCVELLIRFLKEDILLKNEQIKFLELIIDYLHSREKLAPVTFLLLENILSATIKQYDLRPNTSWEKAGINIKELRNTVFFIFIKYLDSFNASEFLSTDIIKLKVVYNTKPTIPLIDILTAFKPSCESPTLLKTETGSFIEWISCPENIITCMELFLKLLGCTVVPIMSIFIKNKLETMQTQKQKTYNKKENNNTEDQREMIILSRKSELFNETISLPSIITTPPSKGLSNAISNATRVIVDLNILHEKDKCGYNNTNIKEIRIIYEDVVNSR